MNEQPEVKQDWDNREYEQVISTSIKKMSEFFNHFDSSCRVRLAKMDERLSRLEKQVDLIEAQVNQANSQR